MKYFLAKNSHVLFNRHWTALGRQLLGVGLPWERFNKTRFQWILNSRTKQKVFASQLATQRPGSDEHCCMGRKKRPIIQAQYILAKRPWEHKVFKPSRIGPVSSPPPKRNVILPFQRPVGQNRAIWSSQEQVYALCLFLSQPYLYPQALHFRAALWSIKKYFSKVTNPAQQGCCCTASRPCGQT